MTSLTYCCSECGQDSRSRSFPELFASFTAVVLAVISQTQSLAAAETPPNVVLIFADDLGYGDLGCYGATKLKTPNIDQLAAEGRRFTDAHSASAVCTPSRYGLLTGEYPIRALDGKGVWGPSAKALLFDPDEPNIANVLKKEGYATAAIGKWHLGFGDGKQTFSWVPPLKYGPRRVGFDYYWGIPNVNSGPPYIYVENDTIVGYDPVDPPRPNGKPFSPTTTYPEAAGRKGPNRFGGALEAHRIYDDEKTGTYMTEKAVTWIKENKKNPFFLYFATTNIHHPFTPAPRFKGTSQCGLYGDFVHELDWMVGEILKSLEDNGLSDNTLVIFTSDNGGMLNHTGRIAMNAGHKINGDLLGFKFGVWEGGHRVPFIARWPGKIKAGTESDQLLGQVDMLATLMALTGQDNEALEAKDSVNMLPALVDDPDRPIRTELLLAPRKSRNLAIRKGKWVYIGAKSSGGFTGGKPTDHGWGGPPAVAFANSANSDIENGRLKKDALPAQLYDLEKDQAQTTNDYLENPQVVKEMQARLNALRSAKETTQNTDAPARKRRSNRKQKEAVPPGASSATPSAAPASLAAPSISSATRAVAAKPNFVVIFTDNQGYGDLSCFGGEHVSTPRTDRMAAEGSRLPSFYVAAPVCTPSRAALMTGCYPKRIDMATGANFGVLLAGDRKGLNSDEITIAEVLKSAGYKTGMFGKWHLGDQPEFLPTRQGLDEYLGIPYSHDIHPFHPKQSRFKLPSLALLDNEKVIEMDPDADYLTKRITEGAVKFIKKNKDVPFFLYVPHPIPHVPLHVAPPFMKGVSKDTLEALKQENGNIDYNARESLFRQAIAEIDWSVGQILDTLKANGLDERTLVIFTSDNGPGRYRGRGKGKPAEHAGPLRGPKGTTFEGGMREPTVIRWPGKIPAGKDNGELMTAMDLLPTFAKLVGAEIPTDRTIDGKDVWPTLVGEKQTPHESFFYHRGNDLQAVRSGKWKLHTLKGKPTQLYDLENDIGEQTNVIKSHPEVVKELNGYLKAFAKDIAENSRAAAFVENPKPLSK